MRIGIVGTSINLTEGEERDVRQTIAYILTKYNPQDTTIVSGGAKGVDNIAQEIGLGLGFAVKPIFPMGIGWEAYSKRNIEIAEDCEKLYCVSIPKRKVTCYHHDTPQDHEKTAGCWTLKKAKELGKETELMVTIKR